MQQNIFAYIFAPQFKNVKFKLNIQPNVWVKRLSTMEIIGALIGLLSFKSLSIVSSYVIIPGHTGHRSKSIFPGSPNDSCIWLNTLSVHVYTQKYNSFIYTSFNCSNFWYSSEYLSMCAWNFGFQLHLLNMLFFFVLLAYFRFNKAFVALSPHKDLSCVHIFFNRNFTKWQSSLVCWSCILCTEDFFLKKWKCCIIFLDEKINEPCYFDKSLETYTSDETISSRRWVYVVVIVKGLHDWTTCDRFL